MVKLIPAALGFTHHMVYNIQVGKFLFYFAQSGTVVFFFQKVYDITIEQIIIDQRF